MVCKRHKQLNISLIFHLTKLFVVMFSSANFYFVSSGFGRLLEWLKAARVGRRERKKGDKKEGTTV